MERVLAAKDVMTTPAKINKALKAYGINGQITRNPKGYYYFIGCLFGIVPSIYSFNLFGYTTEQIIEHVKQFYNLDNEK